MCVIDQENNQTFHRKNKRTISGIASKNALKTIKEIVKLSSENNIELYVFTTPVNNVKMDSYIIEDYIEFISGISEITNFYNFSGYNSITMNNCNYYEHAHYRPLVARLIAAVIFKEESMLVPTDFGVYVTQDNIDEHLERLRSQMIVYDIGKNLHSSEKVAD